MNKEDIKIGDKVRYKDSKIVGKVKDIIYSEYWCTHFVTVKVGLFKKYFWFLSSIEKVDKKK